MNFTNANILLWIFPILIISFFLSYFLYKGKQQNWYNEIPKWKRILLISLRTATLTLLGILLLNIEIKSTNYRNEKPILINLIDNSKSMTNYSDSNSVLKQINTYINQSSQSLSEKFEIKNLIIDADISNATDVNLKGEKSNLSKAFDEIYQLYYKRNIGAIHLISDGNFNEGHSPIYLINKFIGTPIYTSYVGDTITKKDAFIKDVYTNEIAFLNNKFPIQAQIETNKLPNKNVIVGIYNQGKLLKNTTVKTKNQNNDFITINFEVEAKNIGFQQFDIIISPIEGEFTLANNRKSIFIEILDNKSKVLILAQAPHPDLSAIKSVLDSDENIQVEMKLIPDWKQDIKNVDLVIWHDPANGFNPKTHQLFTSNKISVLYFLGTRTTQETINQLDLNFAISNNRQIDESQANFNTGFNKFTLSDEVKNIIKKYPPLVVKYGQVKLNNQQQTLFYQSVAGIQKNEPLMFFGENQQQKYGVIYGEGIWKWKLYEFTTNKSTDNFKELFQKTTQYLTVKNNTSPLRISLPKRFYTSDDIQIKAEFYNDAMELITTPEISFNLTNSNTNKKNKSTFSRADKNYLLNLGRLNTGQYSWSAETTFNGKKIQKTGSFIVEELSIEKMDNKTNYEVLSQLANNTNGKISPLKESLKIIQELNKNGNIVDVSYEENTFKNLIDYKIIFTLIVLFITVEWFIRRRNGSY